MIDDMATTNLLVPTYQHMLQTLSGLLDKAHQQMPDQAEALLAARLAADMFPLAAQVAVSIPAAEATIDDGNVWEMDLGAIGGGLHAVVRRG